MPTQNQPQQLNHDQLIANINAMEKQGAQPHEVQSYLDSLKSSTQSTQTVGNQFGTPFSVTGKENTPEIAGKYLGNIVPSTANDFGPILTNPGGVIQGASSLLHGAASELGRALGTGVNVGQPKTPQEQMFDSLIGQYKENYFTSPENAEKKIVEDPAGFISDAATLFLAGQGAIKGVANIADTTGGTTASDLMAAEKPDPLTNITDLSGTGQYDKSIEAGAIPRNSVYADAKGTLQPAVAQGRIDDIATKLENFQPGLGDSFRSKVSVNGNTMDDLISAGKDTLLNESTGKFQGLVSNALTNNLPGRFASQAGGYLENKASGVASLIGDAAKSVLSHVTGLEPQDITNILSNPPLFTRAEMDGTTRQALAQWLQDSMDQKASDLGDTGPEYTSYRQLPGPINVSQQGYMNILKDNGIDATFDPKTGWDLQTSAESKPLSDADITALKRYLNQYASSDTHTGNSFIEARHGANLYLAKFGKVDAAGRTTNLQDLGEDFYNYLNTAGRPQIPGLEDTDAKTAPLLTDINQAKSDFFNKVSGDLKDTAASKLANAGNKPALLARLENLMPGFTEKLQNLKTMENIAAASGNKVGNYTRAMSEVVGIGGAAGIFGGPAAAIGVGGPTSLLLGILSNPSISVPVLRYMGYSGDALNAVNQSAQTVAPLLQGANVNNQSQRQGLINPQSLNPQL